MSAEYLKNVACEECGDIMPIAIVHEGCKAICKHCAEPQIFSPGNTASAHWDDDPSGASGSWDLAVRLMEDK